MSAKYETIVIYKPEVTDETVNDLAAKFEEVVKNFSGELVMKDDWGKLKTAFEVSGFAKGRFVCYNYSGNGGVVAEIERNLRNNDEVIRFLTVKQVENYDYIKIRSRLEYLGHKKKGVFGPNIEYKPEPAAVELDDDIKDEL